MGVSQSTADLPAGSGNVKRIAEPKSWSASGTESDADGWERVGRSRVSSSDNDCDPWNGPSGEVETMGRSVSVLVTGAAGRVGRATCQGLLERGHKVRAFDLRQTPGIDDMVVGSITEAARIRAAMESVEVVVHLAATPDEDDFLTQLLPNNIVGLYNVLEAARDAGVGRLVLASSGQVVMGHRRRWPLGPETPFSPRNWYAATKVLAEVAGQVYAYVHGLSVVVARLGWCPRDAAHAAQLASHEFGPDVYLSPRDAARFFAAVVEATRQISYCVVFVTSRPAHTSRFDISAARDLFGFEPEDTWPEGTEFAVA